MDMATLTIELPDPVLKRIEVSARSHGHTVEEESVELLELAIAEKADASEVKKVDWANLPLIEDKDDLLKAVNEFHRDLASRGVFISSEEINDAIKEARR